MDLLRTIVAMTAIYGSMGVMGVVGAPFVLWSRDACYFWMRRYARLTCAILRVTHGIRCEVRGTAPDRPVVVAAKHQSILDVLMLFDALPRAKFVMKRSLLWMPVFGLYTWRIGSVPIDRSARGQGGKVLKSMGEQSHEQGQVVIYPQGTRVPPGREAPYRRGAAMLYRHFELPMVLAATNTGWFWPKRGLLRGPGTAVIEFLETLPPGLPGHQAMARMEAAIEAASDRLNEETAAELGLPLKAEAAE